MRVKAVTVVVWAEAAVAADWVPTKEPAELVKGLRSTFETVFGRGAIVGDVRIEFSETEGKEV